MCVASSVGICFVARGMPLRMSMWRKKSEPEFKGKALDLGDVCFEEASFLLFPIHGLFCVWGWSIDTVDVYEILHQLKDGFNHPSWCRIPSALSIGIYATPERLGPWHEERSDLQRLCQAGPVNWVEIIAGKRKKVRWIWCHLPKSAQNEEGNLNESNI